MRSPPMLDIALMCPDASGAHAGNFAVERIAVDASDPIRVDDGTEAILLVPDGGVVVDGNSIDQPAAAILPAGTWNVWCEAKRAPFLIRPRRADPPVAGVAPPGAPFTRISPLRRPEIVLVSQWQAPAAKPRLRMLQSAALSINWVEYDGPRDRAALSPHNHADFEQGSLAIHGDYVHHLRAPWGKNADEWRADRHLVAGPGTLAVFPPKIIHTSEGVGSGRHLLIDIFSPPRRDFIHNGWIANAGDYADPGCSPA